MNLSERYMTTFSKIAEERKISLFEATAAYIEENDLDTDELMSVLDNHAKSMIRASAVENNFVRKCVQPPTTQLEFV